MPTDDPARPPLSTPIREYARTHLDGLRNARLRLCGALDEKHSVLLRERNPVLYRRSTHVSTHVSTLRVPREYPHPPIED